MRIANTSGYILEIQNMLVPFNSSSMREVMIEYITDFNITCNSPKYDVIWYIAKELESIFDQIFFMSTS